MSLIYLEDGDGNTLTIVASKITAIQSKRVPTNTPTIVWLDNGSHFDVRGSADIAQQKLATALKP